MQKLSIETCLEKKKKQKEALEEIGIKNDRRSKKQAERVSKKIPSSSSSRKKKKKYYFFCLV